MQSSILISSLMLDLHIYCKINDPVGISNYLIWRVDLVVVRVQPLLPVNM